MSRAERLIVALVLCLSLDFASPFVAGAFRFEADESVEGMCARGRQALQRAETRVPVPESSDPRPRRLLAPEPVREVWARTAWLASLRRSHVASSRVPGSSEDH
jgi:hypothetical protein